MATITEDLGFKCASRIYNRLKKNSEFIDHVEKEYRLQKAFFYNGREHGIVLFQTKYAPDNTKTNILVFGEERRSDCTFVDTWQTDIGYLNPPTVNDFTEEAYNNRICFNYNEDEKVVNKIIEIIKQWD